MTHGDHSRGARHGDVGLEIGRQGMQPIEDYVKKARAADRPYFLWYAPMMPHTPHNPPERLLKKYATVAPTEPIAKYWAMCEWFDETIGQLREIVNKHGRPDNTLIVYVTDNGWINLPDKSAYAPRSKRSQYEGGIRTPIMFHWSGHVTPGRDEEHLVSSIDLVPTTLALLKQPAVADLPGINVLDDKAIHDRQAILRRDSGTRHRRYGEARSELDVSLDDSRSPKVHHAAGWCHGRLQSAMEFFDLKTDPNENVNLIDTLGKQEVAELIQQLDRWWTVPRQVD